MTAFRVAHDVEYQKLWRTNVPEVFHFDQDCPTKLTESWQKLILALNPGMDGKGFRSLLRWNTAFTNISGFDNPDGTKRADYINKLDLNARPPVADKVRICGGAIFHGVLNGNLITVETLNGCQPAPSLNYLLARPWLYFEAITVTETGANANFPQNHGYNVYFPLVACGKVTVKYNTKVLGKPYPFVQKA